ncbi:C6 transcription factor (Fcr1) [Penicillium odoratum]|uniref:C6 transcription factor (Fcr1) n=1 Tax=Penicillium odoratum TaxID=1167516 RepID=UPI0025498329|nr:C6 transcription factor (Fcr1) [Penicillium odoratum]KAJ5772597.1 C6 transcription factor (Fcr1) [Penicillium odoratum]
MPIACLLIGRSFEKRYIPRGIFRYTRFLEEQQGWLVHGIRALYQHVQAGDGWPGEPLNCDANGQPLVHDILARLGSLDQAGRSNSGESVRTKQQRPENPKVETLQRPQSSSGTSHSLTPVEASPITPNYPLSSPGIHPNHNTETGDDSLPSMKTIADSSGLHSPFQIVSSSRVDDSIERDMRGPASPTEILCNDVQASSLPLEYPTKDDAMPSDLFTGIGNDFDDWEGFLQPFGQVSTEAYSMPNHDTQPLPFGYAA